MTHEHYNRVDFPHFVVNNGNWDICANEHGYCASIPTPSAEAGGCKATHFGDVRYVKVTLGVDAAAILADAMALAAAAAIPVATDEFDAAVDAASDACEAHGPGAAQTLGGRVLALLLQRNDDHINRRLYGG